MKGEVKMVTSTQLYFNLKQNIFMLWALKCPFVRNLNKGGWLKDPFSDRDLAGVTVFESPKIVAIIIDFVISKILDDGVSVRNRELCLKYGLIEPVDENDMDESI